MQGDHTNKQLETIRVPYTLGDIPEQDYAASQGLVHARLEARVLDDFPGHMPTTLDQAYAMQAASISQWPDDVVAWKVARFPPNDRGRFPGERLVGPAFRSTIRVVESGSSTVSNIHAGGFAVIEAEFVLELGADIPPIAKEWSDEALARQIAAAYGGAEIASSPMPNVIELGAMAIIPDLGINDGVIVGPEITDFLSLPADALSVRVSVDGSVVGEANPGPIADDPFDALRFLFANCASRGIELPKGTLVSSGLLTGAHDVRAGSVARVDYGAFGRFDVSFEAFTRR